MATQQERLSRVEGIVEQMSARLDSIESRLTSLESSVKSSFIAILVAIAVGWLTTMGTIITLFLAT